MIHDQTRQLKPTPLGRDRWWQVQGQITRLKRGLARLQIANGPDLGQEHGLTTGRRDKGLGQCPRAAPGRGQDNGFRQGGGIVSAKGLVKAASQIGNEGAVRGDSEPTRPSLRQERGHFT